MAVDPNNPERNSVGSDINHVTPSSLNNNVSGYYFQPGGYNYGEMLRTQLTIESNSPRRQNLIGYLIANLKPKLWEERASQIHIPSWKLHFESHLCS